jgi:putative protease
MDRKVELLAPAGNYEKLEIAIHYGADAVYLAGKDFSLRNFSGNFTLDELKDAVRYSHDRGVRVYLACNIFARNHEQIAITEYFRALRSIDIDGIIVSDPGIFDTTQELLPEIPVHLSTQANTNNLNSVRFWERLGVRRVNLARELSLDEVRGIAQNNPLEIEVFVHGAMCISYSGRCLLSSFMAGRDSNRGMCAHPCRWKYVLEEETRPGKYMPIEEDARGTYIFNSKDLCMVEHIPRLIEAGVSSLKIEGRMKGIHYVATVVKVYREAIDSYYRDPEKYVVKNDWIEELVAVGTRGYCTGFYFGDPSQRVLNFKNEPTAPLHRFAAKVIRTNGSNRVFLEIRNKIHVGDLVSVLPKSGPSYRDRIGAILDADGFPVSFSQPGSRTEVVLKKNCLPNDMIRTLHENLSGKST